MCMKHLFDIFPSRALAALALATGLLAGCSKETGEWENNGRTATIALRVPMAGSAATRTTPEEYEEAENKINTLRVLIISQDNKEIVNKKFDNPGETVTIDNVPVGQVTICAIANEAALGKNYDQFSDFEADLVTVGSKDKLLIKDESRSHFPKRFTEQEIKQYGLPMSWIDREVEIAKPTGTPQTIEVELERAVAKLNIIMHNALSESITITEMSFGNFFSDQLYLFREETLDIPDNAGYAGQVYGDDETISIEIPNGESKTLALYIYPSYAWRTPGTLSPYTIGFKTLAGGDYEAKAFINDYGGALNSIVRNTQVNINATLSIEAIVQLNFEVRDWALQSIDVPSFD